VYGRILPPDATDEDIKWYKNEQEKIKNFK
jgi:hypothetical protein